LLLGLPIPAIFVATNRDGTWDVVDGLQRVCTVLRFFGVDVPGSERLQFSDDRLTLGEMMQLPSFSGLTYEKLPAPIRLALGKRYIRVQVLSDKSDHEVRFELFRRLNAGAVALTPQEIRACVLRGSFNDFIEELAGVTEYKALLKLKSVDQHNATAEEVVLKFFAYLDASDDFNGKVTKFLDTYMFRRANDTDLETDRKLFVSVVKHLFATTGGAFLRKGVNVTPLNQFEAVLVGIGQVIREGRTPSTPPVNWQNDQALVEASTKGTNSRRSLNARITRAQELFS
jgi:hypothetical protein